MKYKLSPSGYRRFVAGIDAKIPLLNGNYTTAINFDNAASTPPLVSVMEEINNFAAVYSSVHRGAGYKSQISSHIYEEARSVVLNFVQGDPQRDTVIFLKNTTEAINKLSYRLLDGSPQNVVLSTCMEHHSNDLPWRNKFQVDYVQTDAQGKLSLEDLEQKLNLYKGRVRLVTVTGASNVTGYINPIHIIAELAHRYNAQILVDGAQLVPHHPVSMKAKNPLQHIDYLAFSAHKMYAPFGIGVLIGPKEAFRQGDPEYAGGGAVETVTHDWVVWAEPPHKEEAGSPNVMGVVALVAAIKTLTAIGLKNIDSYENELTGYAVQKLKSIPGLTLYSHTAPGEPRIGVIPFTLQGMSHSQVAAILSSEAGIAVRTGCFCAQPYIQRLLSISPAQMEYYKNHPGAPRPGVVRLSFGMYNDFSEINVLAHTLAKIIRQPSLYTNCM